MDFKMYVPCLFGLEGLVADELKRLNMRDVKADNGHVTFTGDKGDNTRSSVNLRTGERIMLIVGQSRASSFDELFEGVKSMSWEKFIPIDGAFPVKGHSLNSILHSIPDCQRIIKKAIVERLKSNTNYSGFRNPGQNTRYSFLL